MGVSVPVQSETAVNRQAMKRTDRPVRATGKTATGVNVVEDAVRSSDAAAELVEAGVHTRAARALARRYPARRISAAIRYVQSSRSAVINPPGYIRFVLAAEMQIPRWCFEDLKPAPRPQETPVAPRSAPTPTPAPVPAPGRKVRRKASLHAPVWDAVQETIRQQILPESFDRWISPLSIADVKGEQVVLDAPDGETAEWVSEHYLWALQPALVAAGLPCRSIAVKAHITGSASDV